MIRGQDSTLAFQDERGLDSYRVKVSAFAQHGALGGHGEAFTVSDSYAVGVDDCHSACECRGHSVQWSLSWLLGWLVVCGLIRRQTRPNRSSDVRGEGRGLVRGLVGDNGGKLFSLFHLKLKVFNHELARIIHSKLILGSGTGRHLDGILQGLELRCLALCVLLVRW